MSLESSGGFGSELKLRGLQNDAATSIKGKHTAFSSSNPCSPPIRVSCSTTDAWLGGIRRWNQTLKYRLRKFFKVGVRSRQEGSAPGSLGIFGTSDSYPKTTSAPAKSASYMLQTTTTTTTAPPPDTLQTAIQQKLARQIVKPIEKSSGGAQRKQRAGVSRRLQGGLAGGRPLRRRALIAVEICSFHRDSMIGEMRAWATSRLPLTSTKSFRRCSHRPKSGRKKVN